MEGCNPWVAPKAFVFEGLVVTVVRSQLRWQQTLQALRLVSRAWRYGVSSVVPLLAPRPTSCTSDLVHIPSILSSLQLLRLQSIVTDGPSFEVLMPTLCEGLPSLRTLLLLNCPITETSTAAFSRLSSLERLDLEAPFPATLATLEVLATCSRLRHLRFRPTAGMLWSDSLNLLRLACRLTALHSLSCPVRYATSAHLAAALAPMAQLSSLTLYDLPLTAVPALAGVVPRLRKLELFAGMNFSPMEPPAGDEADPDSLLSLPQLLPLSHLSSLTALAAPWELFSDGQQLRHLAALTSLVLDFHASFSGDENPDPTTVRIFRSLSSLQRLRMVDGRSEVSSAALCHVSRLAPSLTALDLEIMYSVSDSVAKAISNLHCLRRLRLMSTSFSAKGIRHLSRLGALTQLVLINSAGVMNPLDLTDALVQVKGLRHLRLESHPYVRQQALWRLLDGLQPHMELLQTSWQPPYDDEDSARLCCSWHLVLQHGLGMPAGDSITRGWADFDAAEALAQAGLGGL